MFTVVIHGLVFAKDFRAISRDGQKQILRAVEKKLTTRPDLYGRPLAGDLKGYWKLKTGPYRVIYQISKREIKVYVIAVGFRRNEAAYIQAAKRLGLI